MVRFNSTFTNNTALGGCATATIHNRYLYIDKLFHITLIKYGNENINTLSHKYIIETHILIQN